MKRGDKKIASNASLFCCSEHFSEKDYRKSLTGKRHDLVTNAFPSIFPWSVPNDEVMQKERRVVKKGFTVCGPIREYGKQTSFM